VLLCDVFHGIVYRCALVCLLWGYFKCNVKFLGFLMTLHLKKGYTKHTIEHLNTFGGSEGYWRANLLRIVVVSWCLCVLFSFIIVRVGTLCDVLHRKVYTKVCFNFGLHFFVNFFTAKRMDIGWWRLDGGYTS